MMMTLSMNEVRMDQDATGSAAMTIASTLQSKLFDSIHAVISSKEEATKYLHQHYRLRLSNNDQSSESCWYRVHTKKEILEISGYFCPEAILSDRESTVIVNTIIAGYDIDLAQPVYLSYDLNRHIPIEG